MRAMQPEPADAGPTRRWPADQVERWPVERIKRYANNPRRHSEADRDKIAASILAWGWTMPVLVDEEGRLIAGEARLAAALKLQRQCRSAAPPAGQPLQRSRAAFVV